MAMEIRIRHIKNTRREEKNGRTQGRKSSAGAPGLTDTPRTTYITESTFVRNVLAEHLPVSFRVAASLPVALSEVR